MSFIFQQNREVYIPRVTLISELGLLKFAQITNTFNINFPAWSLVFNLLSSPDFIEVPVLVNSGIFDISSYGIIQGDIINWYIAYKQ